MPETPECVCLPEHPIFRSEAEKKVWLALRKKLRDGDILLHGVHFSDTQGDSEVDLIVLMPEGFATVEVKGGRVWFEDGSWRQSTPAGVKPLDLDAQAIGHKHRVGKYLSARWSSGRPRMQHLAALPDASIDAYDPSPGLPRDLVIDKNQISDAAGIIFDSLNRHMTGQPHTPPTPARVEQAAQILAGRGDTQQQIAHRLAAVDTEIQRLTEEQFLILETAERIPRVEVTGGPGTGKTWMALEQARRWTQQQYRTGFVCFSRGLAAWAQRAVANWPQKQQKLMWVGTFHALGSEWGVTVPDDLATEDSEFWETTFLQHMTHSAGSREPIFDALIVDEAQDFADTWWPNLINGLTDAAASPLMVFSDEQQRIFDRTSHVLPGLVPLRVKRNMRNSAPIARIFQPLVEENQDIIGLPGPQPHFIECTTTTAVSTADDAAVALLDEGWQPHDIALLTTHHRHPMQRELTQHDKSQYWSLLWENDDIFYCTVAGFKGLERPAVVVAVDGFRNAAVARQTLLVGLSRARDHLVVCADSNELRRTVGDEVVRRLLR